MFHIIDIPDVFFRIIQDKASLIIAEVSGKIRENDLPAGRIPAVGTGICRAGGQYRNKAGKNSADQHKGGNAFSDIPAGRLSIGSDAADTPVYLLSAFADSGGKRKGRKRDLFRQIDQRMTIAGALRFVKNP